METRVKSAWRLEYLAASAAKYCEKGIKITASEATLVESVIFPDIWKVQTLILVISGLNLFVLDKIGLNSSFTRSGS